MKTKLLYVGLSMFILSTLVFVGITLKDSETDLSDLNSEIRLISDEVDDQEAVEIKSTFIDLKSEIDIQKSLIQENLLTIEALKSYIETNEVELARKDLIYLKLSMGEIRTYRKLFINTFDLMRDEFSALEGQYESLSEDEKADVKQSVTDIITYRLVLLEKINLELINMIDLIQPYEEVN